MFLIKYLISCILAILPPIGEAQDGWFPVEKKGRVEDPLLEADFSKGVLFSKDLEGETMNVQFFSEPSYTYLSGNTMQIKAEKEGKIQKLEIYPLEEGGEKPLDKSSNLFGNTYFTTTFKTKHHLYRFQTIGKPSDEACHREFVASFFVQ